MTTESLNEVTRFRRVIAARSRRTALRVDARPATKVGRTAAWSPWRGRSLERVTSRCRFGDLEEPSRIGSRTGEHAAMLDECSHRRRCSPRVSAISSSNAMIARSLVGLDVWSTEMSFDHEPSWARPASRMMPGDRSGRLSPSVQPPRSGASASVARSTFRGAYVHGPPHSPPCAASGRSRSSGARNVLDRSAQHPRSRSARARPRISHARPLSRARSDEPGPRRASGSREVGTWRSRRSKSQFSRGSTGDEW